MRRIENRPSFQPVANAIKEVKKATGLSNLNFGIRIGVSDCAASNYINGKMFPGIDISGKIFDVIEQAPEIPTTEKRECLHEMFVQSIVPEVIFSSEYQQTYRTNLLERGIKIRETMQVSPRMYRTKEARRRMSNAKTRLPIGDSYDASLVDALVRAYGSNGLLGDAVGVSRQAIYNWKKEGHISSSRRKQLLKLAKDFLPQS